MPRGRYPKIEGDYEMILVRLSQEVADKLRALKRRRTVENGGEEVTLRSIVEEALIRSPLLEEVSTTEPLHIDQIRRTARAKRQYSKRQARRKKATTPGT